jgi:hypothetical protein
MDGILENQSKEERVAVRATIWPPREEDQEEDYYGAFLDFP